MAYDFAKRLKTPKGLTPDQYICKIRIMINETLYKLLISLLNAMKSNPRPTVLPIGRSRPVTTVDLPLAAAPQQPAEADQLKAILKRWGGGIAGTEINLDVRRNLDA
jgi:hypothetical protein